jgi:hypothetical protein
MIGLGPDRTAASQVYIDLAARLPLLRTPTAERIGELTMLAAGTWMVRPLARPAARVSRYSGPLAALAGFTAVVLVVLVVLALRAAQGV